MKVFISWSGAMSKAVAELLKKKLPCIIQSIEVFCSSEDIEKGENWNSRIRQELAECNFGIVCLTKDNVNAPWIQFEAGALSKLDDSRVGVFLIDATMKDISSPLKCFQTTKFNRDEFKKLISSIHKFSGSRVPWENINGTFEAMWEELEISIKEIISTYSNDTENSRKEEKEPKLSNLDEVLEEVLQLLRKQDLLLSNPNNLNRLVNQFIENKENDDYKELFRKFLDSILIDIHGAVDEGKEDWRIYYNTVMFAFENRMKLGLDTPDYILAGMERKIMNDYLQP